MQIYRNNINVNTNNDFYVVRSRCTSTTFDIFSALVYDLYARSTVRVFGFQSRFDDERQRLPTGYQVQVLIRRWIHVHAS